MVNPILAELSMEPFDFNLGGGAQKWTLLHLAGCSGHYKVVEEILDWEPAFPVNVFARTGEGRTGRQCARGNLALTKLMRKAESRQMHAVYYEAGDIKEASLLGNHLSSKKTHYLQYHDREKHKDLIDSNYQSLKDQI